MKRRLLSTFLALVMAMSLLPMSAFATEGAEPLAADAWDGTADTTWYNDTDTEFTLTTAEQLAGLAKLVDGGNNFANKTIKLGADIDLLYVAEGEDEPTCFEPIGSYRKDTAFKGTFDGQSHSIKNLYQNTWALNNGYYYSDLGLGLFGKVEGATIENLTMDGAKISGESGMCGTVAASAYGDCVFENITIKNTQVNDYIYYAGGIVGWASGNHQYINCDVEKSTTIGGQWGCFGNANGGLIGGASTSGTYKLKDCDVACVLDCVNDYVSAYLWGNYRNSGMLIGRVGPKEIKNEVKTLDTPDNVTAENCTVTFGDWADYHYCEFAGTGYPYVRVEAGVSVDQYINIRYGHPTDANGNKVVDYNHVHNEGEDHNRLFEFNYLFGGPADHRYCYYGISEFEGVKVTYTEVNHKLQAMVNEAEAGGTIVLPDNLCDVCDAVVEGKDIIVTGEKDEDGKDCTIPVDTDAIFKVVGEGSVSIIGGTYAYKPDNFVAEGYKAVKNADGSWTVVKRPYIAQVGETKYYDLQTALNSCTNGETVKLLTHITYNDADKVHPSGANTGYDKYGQYYNCIIYTGGTQGATDADNQPSKVNAILDLNGFSITNTADETFLFILMDNTKMTIKDSVGGGSINNGNYPAIWTTGTDTLLTIEDGKFTTTGTNGVLHVTHSSDAIIEGGEFSSSASDTSDLIVRNEEKHNNKYYFQVGSATVTITGGTFYRFNPENTPDDYKGVHYFNAVAKDYKAVEKTENVWVVEKDYIIWVKDQLLAGNDVALDRDIVVDATYIDSIPATTNGNGKYPNYGIFNVVGDKVTFDLNGHTITYNGHKDFQWNGKTYNSCSVAHGLFYANDHADLTIVDSSDNQTGTVQVYGTASGGYVASPDTKLTITGGTWKNEGCKECRGTNLFMYPLQGGELYIEGGFFEQALDGNGDSYLLVNHNGEYKNSVIDYSKTKLVVSGGTFVGMNPEKAHLFKQTADNKLVIGDTINSVAKGYVSVDNKDGSWTVLKAIAEVTFNTDPSNATVIVMKDGKVVSPSDGNAKEYKLSQSEEYTYYVYSSNYYPENGTFTVNGNKMTINVDLNRKPSKPVAPPVDDDEDINDNPPALGNCDGGEDCPSAPYVDVDQSLWYHDGIDYVIVKELMNGVGENLFAPNGTTNRAMIVTILHRLEGTPEAAPSSFVDVPADQWYTDAVGWAAANGIVTGYDADTFGPLDPITREQMAAILYRYADYKGYDVSAGEDTNILSYVDAESVSEYAVTPMQWAVGEGLIAGMEDNTLAPTGTALRSQVATILMRFCENIVK